MAWLSSWSYRKEISITGQSGSGTNYQVDFDIGDSAGGDFHLEGHCTSFPQDIAVTDNDGSTPLDFWIEDVTADPIKMWVEVADDLGSNQTIYIYYGKAETPTGSNIGNTFLFGDDFPGSSIDTGKWDGATGRASVSAGIMTYAGANTWDQLRSITQFGPDVAIKTKIKMFTGTSHIVQWGLNSPGNVHYSHADIRYDPLNLIYSKDGTTASNVNSNWPIDTWFIGELNVIGGTNVAAYIDGVEATGSPKTTNPSNSSELEITFLGRITDSTTAIQSDWILIRKYVATEPAFSSAGSEETPPTGASPTAVFYGPFVGPLGGPI